MILPKFSLGSWAFSFGPFENNPWSFSDFIKYTANAGYDGVEINGFHPHPHPDVYNTAEKCAELKNEISGLGLGISGYAPDFHDVPPAEVPVENYLKVLKKCLTFCSHMDISILRVDTVSPPVEHSEDEYNKRFDHLVSTWYAAAEECKENDVVLVWEFEPGFWLNKPSEVKSLVEAVGHSHFKVLFDSSHSYMGAVIGARQTGEKETLPGGTAEYAKYLEGYIGHLHLIDSDGSLHDDETSTHTSFGQGYIDFKKLLLALKSSIENLEWWCFDFCFNPNTELDAKKSLSFVKDIVSQIPD